MRVFEGTTLLGRSLISASSTFSETSRPVLPRGHRDLRLPPAPKRLQRSVLLGSPFDVRLVRSCRGGIRASRLIGTFPSRKPEAAVGKLKPRKHSSIHAGRASQSIWRCHHR